MKLFSIALFFAVTVLPLATACGGTDMAPAVPSGPSAPSANVPQSPSAAGPTGSAATAEPATWKETASKDQKLAYMKAKVLPAMAKVPKAASAQMSPAKPATVRTMPIQKRSCRSSR